MSNSSNETRPAIGLISSSTELRRWYWLKTNLVACAKQHGLKTTGGKFQILDRICHFLDTGEKTWPGDASAKVASDFDWHKEPLSPETIITDSYKNSQNVRRFFTSQVGSGFKFNIEFMAWMRANVGNTLGDAVVEYKAMKVREADPDFQSVIADHNQFNQYTRDFLDHHPEMGMEEVRKYWALKTKLPSNDGRHIYDPSDLDLK